MNMHRRHLTPSQRSTAGAKIANMRVGNFSKSNSARLPISPVSQAQAAKMVGVSTSMVTAAAKVAREAPELVPRIEKGEMTVHGEMRHYPVGNRSSATGAAGCGLPCARPGRCVVRGDRVAVVRIAPGGKADHAPRMLPLPSRTGGVRDRAAVAARHSGLRTSTPLRGLTAAGMEQIRRLSGARLGCVCTA